MGDAYKEIQRQIAILRELGNLPEAIAPLAAREVKKDIIEHTKRGENPEGEPWPKTQTGQAPLQNVEKALKVRVFGSTVVASLDGHYARHHLGAVTGGVRREILPTRRVPDTMARALKKVAEREYKKITEPE